RGSGSFDVRGIAVRIADNPNHVPIGLLMNAVVNRRIEPGQQISFDDVELPESLALRAWQIIAQQAIPASPTPS
ncbi:MAG: NAD(P)-dependent oxidoreductase, partial [Dehalococcoidia bacterium]|nr:NAD(P)-dependent oxidoreductase [Dehalococcoidia bacterium]